MKYAWLGKNIMSEDRKQAMIPYFIPEYASEAAVEIIDQSGMKIQSYQLKAGYGEIQVKQNSILRQAGTYKLLIDKETIATKEWIKPLIN